ncbi:MAG: hypothetical protein ACR2G2_17065 [Pseudonocardia sp.]
MQGAQRVDVPSPNSTPKTPPSQRPGPDTAALLDALPHLALNLTYAPPDRIGSSAPADWDPNAEGGLPRSAGTKASP